MTLRDHWDREASRWAAWAREPGHDSYHHYAESFFAELVPPPAGRTLELGCGEGRVCRDLAARDHAVTGVDASPSMLALAREADPRGEYVLADASSLPFPDESFALVVAYNSLMDLDDMPAGLREAARVLETGGHLCASVVHPFQGAGEFEAAQADARFVVDGSYLQSRLFDLPTERRGLEVTFRGRHHPLEAYSRALEVAGFTIEAIREPPAPPSAVARDPDDARWQRIPMFLWFRARLAARGAAA